MVYTDHSMFSFADAACIHMNKIFKFFLTHCDHCICVSHTHKENLVLRGALNPHQIAVINNAVVSGFEKDFTPTAIEAEGLTSAAEYACGAL